MPPSYLSAKSMNAINGTFIGLTVIMTALRFYARRFQKTTYLTADWLILPALLNFLGCTVALIYDVHIKAMGYSSAEFNASDTGRNTYKSQQVSVVVAVMSALCLGCVKSSACMFYRSIFCVGERRSTLNLVILTTVGLIAAWSVAYALLAGLQCGSHLQDYLQDPSVGAEYCVSFPYYYSLGITDVMFDIWVLLLPIPCILRLKTTLARRASILGVFLLACGGLAAGITRLVVFTQIYFGGFEGLVTGDFEITSTKIEFFMILEAGLAFIAVNMPSVWMLVTVHGPESILQSVRSTISISSNRSKDSQHSHDPESLSKYASDSTKGPRLVGSVSSSSAETQGETFSIADIRVKGVLPAALGQVHVK